MDKPVPLIGQEIKAPPKVKVILVKEEMTELEDQLTKGWKIAASYPHAKGALFLLMRD